MPPNLPKEALPFSRRVQNFIQEIGEALPDIVLLTTAAVGSFLGIFGRIANLTGEKGFFKEPTSVALTILGFLAAGVWADRKKSQRFLDEQIGKQSNSLMGLIDQQRQLQETVPELIRTQSEAHSSAVSELKQQHSGLLAELNKQHQDLRRVIPILKTMSGQSVGVQQEIEGLVDARARLSSITGQLGDNQCSVIESFEEEHRMLFHALANGRLELPMYSSPHGNRVLMQHFRSRIDAVSERNLGFWLEPTGSHYYEESVVTRTKDANGRVATRIFILTAEDFRQRNDQIVRVLERHFLDQVGFALVIGEPDYDLDYRSLQDDVRKLKRRGLSVQLDFALFDGNAAVSFFRRRPSNESFEAVLATNDDQHENNELIMAQRSLWVRLIAESWLASSHFAQSIDSTLSPDESDTVCKSSKRYNEALQRFNHEPESSLFPLLVKSAEDIPVKVRAMYELWKASHGRQHL